MNPLDSVKIEILSTKLNFNTSDLVTELAVPHSRAACVYNLIALFIDIRNTWTEQVPF